jgi:hypothetical protein
MSDRHPSQAVTAHEKHGEKAAYDALEHDKLARAIVYHIENMLPGSVIAVQGAWGRGKTDVVDRVYRLFEAADGPAPIWIDPWQYGRPDLIQPVVVELLRRSAGSPRDKRERIRQTAKTLLLASNAMAFKAVSVFVPFGSIIDPAKEPVDDLIKRALGGEGSPADAEADPVHEMAEKFRELVEDTVSGSTVSGSTVSGSTVSGSTVSGSTVSGSTVSGSTGDTGGRLLICVDDLDRCLPDNQIAMLEAIHFLTSARANCVFLIAIDPFLVQQAAVAHYRTSSIDINQYLDKLFQLRLNLRSLLPRQIGELVKAELGNEKVREQLGGGLHVRPAAVQVAFSQVFDLPELTNPRLVHRTFERLRLAAAANVGIQSPAIQGEGALVPLVTWCAIAERWPQLRQLLQAASDDLGTWYANIKAIRWHYDCWPGTGDKNKDEAEKEKFLAQAASIIDRLPGRRQQPDLGKFLSERFFADESSARRQLPLFREIDAALVSMGL